MRYYNTNAIFRQYHRLSGTLIDEKLFRKIMKHLSLDLIGYVVICVKELDYIIMRKKKEGLVDEELIFPRINSIVFCVK